MKNILAKYKEMPNSVKASLWFTVCSILQKGISFITVPLFTRLLTPEEYGVFSLFLSWQSLIAIFATLNLSYQVFNNGMVKFENDKAGYTTAMLGLSNLATVILFFVYLIFHNLINRLTGLETIHFILMFIGYFFTSATSLWTVEQRYLFRYKALCFVTIFISLGVAILGVVLVSNYHYGISRILADVIVTCSVGFVIYIVLLKENSHLINLKYWKYALSLDLPLIIHYLSMNVFNSADRIMISSICGLKYVALYSVPFNASMVMQIIITSINASFTPWTYQKCKESKWSDINHTSLYLILFIFGITLLPSLFAPELVWVLGSSKYAAAAWVVPPVSCSVFFSFLYSLFTNIEFYFENTKNITKATLFASVLNVVLNFIFINKFGYIAAAYTTLICYMFLSLIHYVYMKRILKENNIKEKVYNTKIVVCISFFIVLYSVLVSFTYKFNYFLRYGLILIIIGVIFVNKKRIMETLKH